MYVGNSWLVREDVSRVLCFCIMDRPRQIFARSQYVGALNDIADTYLKPVILHMLSIYQCILHHICIYIYNIMWLNRIRSQNCQIWWFLASQYLYENHSRVVCWFQIPSSKQTSWLWTLPLFIGKSSIHWSNSIANCSYIHYESLLLLTNINFY